MNRYNSTTNLNAHDSFSERPYNGLASTGSMLVRDAKSRSFLVGSLSALNGKSLLSYDELDKNLFERKAKVLISTWNMGGIKSIPSNMTDLLLPDSIQTVPDVYVIGVQEFAMKQ
jgi:hypothetical protein